MQKYSNRSKVKNQDFRAEAAIRFSRQHGLKLFPVRKDAKDPAIRDFDAKATDDPEQLRKWLAAGNRNTGVACGPSGIVVVDSDIKHGIDGEANLIALAEADPIHEAQLDDTLIIESPTGGRHRYFRTSAPIRNSAGKIASGVDIRAKGGYVLAPGSQVAGKPYRIVNASEIADMPDWLRDVIEAADAKTEARKAPAGIELDTDAAVERARQYLLTDAPLAVEGSHGDATTFLVAAHVHDFGVSEAVALELMAEHWDPRCSPPWGDGLAVKVANGFQYAQNETGCDDLASEFDILDDATADKIGEPANDNGGSVLDRGTLDLRALAGRPVPARAWLAEGWIPGRNVTLLYGDGGTGKSLAAMQLAIAAATGTSWLGLPVAAGRALYLTAEDDADELHRRIVAVANGQGFLLDDLADNLKAVSLAADDPVLAVAGDKDRLKKTPLWRDLVRLIGDWRPLLVVLDTLADIFAGNENVRSQARAFIGMLRTVAIEHGTTILVLAHPSRSGLEAHGANAAAGSSGSTAWHNSVRSRLVLKRDDKTGQRVLSVAKANYGEAGAELRLRWHDGAFVMEGGLKADAEVDKEAERVFMDLLDQYTTEGRHVGAKKGTSFAPSVFASDERSGMFDSAALADAMNRLFAAGKIRVEEYGPPSRRHEKIVRSQIEAEAA